MAMFSQTLLTTVLPVAAIAGGTRFRGVPGVPESLRRSGRSEADTRALSAGIRLTPGSRRGQTGGIAERVGALAGDTVCFTVIALYRNWPMLGG
jgi:hypothetical protein